MSLQESRRPKLSSNLLISPKIDAYSLYLIQLMIKLILLNHYNGEEFMGLGPLS
jgi:hypothetical protein